MEKRFTFLVEVKAEDRNDAISFFTALAIEGNTMHAEGKIDNVNILDGINLVQVVPEMPVRN